MATAPTAKAKTVRVRAVYPFCDVPVGDTQTMWGVGFTHEVVKQKGEEFHILTAELDVDIADAMFECGRVEKA